MDNLKREVAENIPQIAASAVERLEQQLGQRLEKETGSMKAKYESQIETLRRDLLEAQATRRQTEVREACGKSRTPDADSAAWTRSNCRRCRTEVR
jgi:hypothetical protein